MCYIIYTYIVISSTRKYSFVTQQIKDCDQKPKYDNLFITERIYVYVCVISWVFISLL